MTPQEQEMIGDLVDRVQKTQLAEKDMDAEQMLKQGMGKNPDALYILAQTVLVQKYALEQAQMQLTQAKAQIEQMQQHPEPKHTSSFLGNLLGRSDAPAPPPPPPAQGWATVPAYPQSAPGVGYPQSAAPVGMGGGGGFLQGALQTAAGVAAGALAFEGVESLMHGFGHAAGYGQGFGGFGDRPTEVINNYYGDDRGDRGEHGVSNDERVIGEGIETLEVAGTIEARVWTTGGRVMLRMLRRSTTVDRASMIALASMTVDRILTMGAAALTTAAGTLVGAETTAVLSES